MGQHLQLQATASFIGNQVSGQDVSSQVSWTSSNQDIAAVDRSGNVSPFSRGTTVITARRGPFHQTTTVTVIPAVAVTGLSVAPAAPSVPKGISQQFIATATFADNSTQDVSAAAVWTSSAPRVGSITQGFVSTHSTGSTTIQATFQGFSNSTTLTVTPPVIEQLLINPTSSAIPLGLTQQFRATAMFSDGSTQDLTNIATWSSSNLGVATINSAGLAASVGEGSTTIAAAFQSFSNTSALTIQPALLVSVSIPPGLRYAQVGSTLQLTAIGTYTDGSKKDVTSKASWSSTMPSIASVSQTGFVTAISAGTAVVSASLGTNKGSASINVNGQVSGPLPTIANISPQPATVLDQITITGTNLNGAITVIFSNAIGYPISTPGQNANGTSVTAVVPQGAVTGPLYVLTYPGNFGLVPVQSNILQFQRLARLRIRTPHKDLAAGESVTMQYALLGDATPQTVTFTADIGTFSGATYTAPSGIMADTFARITGCISNTQSCDTLLIGLHPFRIGPDLPLVDIGQSLQLSSLQGGNAIGANWNVLAGGGSVSSTGLYTAGSQLQDGGQAMITATSAGVTEQTAVGVTGAFPGLVNRIYDYSDQHDRNSPGSAVLGMAAIGNRLYVSAVNRGDAQGDGYFWIDVYDISDPVHPAWLTAVEANSSAPVFSTGTYLYSFTDGDRALPSYPRNISLYSAESGIPVLKDQAQPPLWWSIAQHEGVMTVIPLGGLQQDVLVYDVTSGTIKSSAYQVPLPPDANYYNPFVGLAIGSRLFLSILKNGASGYDILTYDLSTSPPTLVGTVDGASLEFSASGNFLFGGTDGMDIYDISGPLPQLQSHVEGLNELQLEGTKVVAGTQQQGYRIVDISDVKNPRITTTLFAGNINPSYGALEVGNYVYVTDVNGGIAIYDASRPGGPIPKVRFHDAVAAWDLHLRPPYLYVPADGALLNIYDISTDPASLVGQYYDPTQAAFVAAQSSGHYLYLGLSGRNDGIFGVHTPPGIGVFDITQPASPVLVTTLPVPALAFARMNNTLFAGTADKNLVVLDISNPAQPAIVSALALPDVPVTMKLAGNLLLVADNTGGLIIYDVTSPMAPALVSTTATFPLVAVEDVAITGTTAFVAGDAEGLLILDISKPAQPVLISETTLSSIEPFDGGPFNEAVSLAINNGLVYVGTFLDNSLVIGLDCRNLAAPRIVSIYPYGDFTDTFVGSFLFDGTNMFVAGSMGDTFPLAQVDMSQPYNIINQYFPPTRLENFAPLGLPQHSLPSVRWNGRGKAADRFWMPQHVKPGEANPKH
jgi:hypothetical protein